MLHRLRKLDVCSRNRKGRHLPYGRDKQETIDDILGLEVTKEKVAVTLALGYRSEEDEFQNFKKVRKPTEKLFKFI